MSTVNEVNPDAGWKPNGRPQSTLARDFSAALDDLFKLNGIGELEESVVQKQDIVQSQKYQLEDLDAKLRETDAKLKRLEANHRRHQSQIQIGRKPVSPSTFAPGPHNEEEDSSGDSDAQGRSSSQRGAGGEERR